MRSLKRNPKHDEAFQNRADLTQNLHFSPAELIALTQIQPPVGRSSSSQFNPILRKVKTTIQVSDTSPVTLSSESRSNGQLKKPKKASESQSIVQYIENTEGYSTEFQISDTV